MWLTLAGLAAASALEREEVGVVTIATQAQVGPFDGVPLSRVQDELLLRQLHHAGAKLVPVVIHIYDLHTHTHKQKHTQIMSSSVSNHTHIQAISSHTHTHTHLLLVPEHVRMYLICATYAQPEHLHLASAGPFIYNHCAFLMPDCVFVLCCTVQHPWHRWSVSPGPQAIHTHLVTECRHYR